MIYILQTTSYLYTFYLSKIEKYFVVIIFVGFVSHARTRTDKFLLVILATK